MKTAIMTSTLFGAAVLLSGCVEDTGSAGMPSSAEQTCLQRVTMETNNPDVVLLGSRAVSGGTEVTVGVGDQRAPWQCIAYSGGGTSRPMSMTNEGAL
jgi:hypothetical protein